MNIDLSQFTLATAKSATSDSITAYSTEWRKDLTLPARTDVKSGLHYLVKKNKDDFSWAKSTDFGAHKEYILPAFAADETTLSGDWKNSFQARDWIIEVDNKSINHRPDLWSHRGIAREVAAIFGFTLKPLEEFLAQHPVNEYKSSVSAQESGSFAISINDPALCRRFAGLKLDAVTNQSSSLLIAQHLIRLDSKVIDAIVDVTNYVMFDIGQPLHAFDAEKISHNAIQVRLAKDKEKIVLLDGQTVELTPQDMVIADDIQPLAVAGIMGGASSAVSLATKSIFLESANFDPAMIWKTAGHIKRRTEASTRFEKNLDPHNNVVGILRFFLLLKK